MDNVQTCDDYVENKVYDIYEVVSIISGLVLPPGKKPILGLLAYMLCIYCARVG
jgi:hypothetical protein